MDGHVIFLGLVLGRRVCYGACLKVVENLCRCCSKFIYNLFSMLVHALFGEDWVEVVYMGLLGVGLIRVPEILL